MTIACEVVDSLPSHIPAIAGNLRVGDAAEISAIGLMPRRAIFQSYLASHYRKTFIVGGRVAAVGGCSGMLLSAEGHPWLMTSLEVERVPLAFVREARKHLRHCLQIHSVLSNFVAARYIRAVGLLEILGFDILPEEEGRLVGPTKELFLKFQMVRG